MLTRLARSWNIETSAYTRFHLKISTRFIWFVILLMVDLLFSDPLTEQLVRSKMVANRPLTFETSCLHLKIASRG